MLKNTKGLKVFALIMLTSMLLIVAAVPNNVKAATTNTVTVFASCAGVTVPASNDTGPYATYTYTSGSTQTFTATPATGFQFLCWVIAGASGSETSTTNPLDYALTQDVAIQAVFIPSGAPPATTTPTTTPATDSVTFFTSVGGTTSPSGQSDSASYVTTSYTAGSTQTFTATPGTGYKLLCWEIVYANGGTTSTDSSLSFVVDQDVAVQAFFIPTNSTVTLPSATTSPSATPTATGVSHFSGFSTTVDISIAIVIIIVVLIIVALLMRARRMKKI